MRLRFWEIRLSDENMTNHKEKKVLRIIEQSKKYIQVIHAIRKIKQIRMIQIKMQHHIRQRRLKIIKVCPIGGMNILFVVYYG